ncbi:MAG: FAD-dependent thymidylate synthase [Methanobrevibacter sp.]|nr:FAD-dependent thymidylate synthase [Methanobrevibacter sp.]
MPRNEKLSKIEHKSSNILDTTIKTEYNCLEAFLRVQLLLGSYLTWDQLKDYIPKFVDATWGLKEHTDEEKEDILIRMFKGEHLPGSMETFRFTFLVTGMTYVGVSHFLRHREITFSAVCTGDRPLAQDNIMVPESIMNSPELFKRYVKTCDEQKQIYKELVDSKKVSTMDARYVLPKSTEQQYFMSMNWLTLIKVIKQRIDRNIQPKEDNLIVMKMWNEILKVYPKLKELHLIDIDQENKFYQLNARKERSTNLYLPEPQDDKFDWRLDDFVYPCKRENLNGTHPEEKKSWFQSIYENFKKIWS